MSFNVIIIGSGPAGCAAALCCRQQGLHVLLVTDAAKERTALVDVCSPSETIHPGVRSVLAQLDAAHCIDTAVRGIYEGIEVNGQVNRLGADELGPWQGWHINRGLFDEALLHTVAAQGIEIKYQHTVTDLLRKEERVTGITTNTGETFTAAFVIDATGHKRFTGKKLHFNEVYCSPPLVCWTGLATQLPQDHYLYGKKYTLFLSGNDGWTWLAPEYDGRCTWTRLSLKGDHDLAPPEELKAFTDAATIKTYNRRWRTFRPVCTEGLLLCGDAAGIIDPAAGQGILNALVAAGMAAKAIKACLEQPAYEALFLAQYDDWFISDYQDKMNRLKGFYAERGILI